MTTVSATQARANFYDLIDEVAVSGKRVGITNKGETKAVIISQEDLDSLEVTLDVMSDSKLMEAIHQGDEDIKAGRVRDWADIKKELGLESEANVSTKSKQPRRKRS